MLLLLGCRYVARGVEARELRVYYSEDSTWSAGGIAANQYFLQFLFLEPNASDPLNKEAAEDLRSNREGFKRNVRTSMSGGAVKSEQYERVIGR